MSAIQRVTMLFLLTTVSLASWGQVRAQATADLRYFPETGHNIRGEFLRFFENSADPLLVFGYPITDEFTSTDGATLQYFQRARFELLADQPEGKRVQLTALGTALYKTGSQQLEINNPSACEPFPTGFRVCFAFLDFFNTNGGTAQFGNPISPFEFHENLIVQYFVKARFEWRADRPEGQRVALADLGRIYFDQFAENQAYLRPIHSLDATISSVLTIHARAFVQKPISPSRGQQVIYILVRSQTNQAISGANGKATIHFTDGRSEDYFFTTNGSGLGSVAFDFADQIQGELVPVDILVTYQGLSATTTASFRIWF
jgi:hypothetical protein